VKVAAPKADAEVESRPAKSDDVETATQKSATRTSKSKS
jgi:hypothetical protein